MFPDHFVHEPGRRQPRAARSGSSFDLRPGVTEVLVHPAVDTPELRAFAPDWPTPRRRPRRARPDAGRPGRRRGVKLIGYRQLRDAQRAARTAA